VGGVVGEMGVLAMFELLAFAVEGVVVVEVMGVLLVVGLLISLLLIELLTPNAVL
jgi:hypothetical protein